MTCFEFSLNSHLYFFTLNLFYMLVSVYLIKGDVYHMTKSFCKNYKTMFVIRGVQTLCVLIERLESI